LRIHNMAGYIEICEFSLGKIIRWIRGRNFLCISGKQRHRKGITTDDEANVISADVIRRS